jgi:hypothetical protein
MDKIKKTMIAVDALGNKYILDEYWTYILDQFGNRVNIIDYEKGEFYIPIRKIRLQKVKDS